MKRSLIDDFFITKKGEWQEGFEGKYRPALEELSLLLGRDLRDIDVEEYLKSENRFVSEKFLRYILNEEKIKGTFKGNVKRALSFITSKEITSRDYDERIEALGIEHAVKTYWEPEDESNIRRIEIVSDAVELRRDDIVIDIGCGVGTFTRRMALKGGKAIGVDYSLSSVWVAMNLAEERAGKGEWIRFVVADAVNLPFKDLSADVIVSADFIEHIDNGQKEGFLDELKRLLKNKGRMVIFTPNRIRESIGSVFGRLRGDEGTRLHFGLTTRFAFERKLRKRGFRYTRKFVDVGRPYLAKIPLLNELLALEILWVVSK